MPLLNQSSYQFVFHPGRGVLHAEGSCSCCFVVLYNFPVVFVFFFFFASQFQNDFEMSVFGCTITKIHVWHMFIYLFIGLSSFILHIFISNILHLFKQMDVDYMEIVFAPGWFKAELCHSSSFYWNFITCNEKPNVTKLRVRNGLRTNIFSVKNGFVSRVFSPKTSRSRFGMILDTKWKSATHQCEPLQQCWDGHFLDSSWFSTVARRF